MSLEPTKHVNGRMWPPGVSGNPNGRPVGSRTAFSHDFLKDLAEVWTAHGRAAMEKTVVDQPGVFFATCARLLPNDVRLTVEQSYAGLSPDDFALLKEVLAAIRRGLPGADQMQAGALLISMPDVEPIAHVS